MKKILSFFSVVLVAISLSAQTSVTVDGIKYIIDGETATVTYPNETEPGTSEYTGDIVIPATITVDEAKYNVTAIGDKAFRKASITSISLPEGLISIGKEALYKSTISEITVPNSVTTLGKYALAESSTLTTITFGSHIADKEWGKWVAWRATGGYDVYMICDAKPTLPDEYTFDDTHLTSIHVKNELAAEYKADPLWNIYNIVKMSVELIDFTVDGIKYKMISDDKVVVTYPTEGKPGSSNPNTYTGDIVIPAQVTYEGQSYKVTGIDDYAFRKANITSISLPEGLTSIGVEAIYNTQITELTVPSTVVNFGQYAMGYNDKLVKVTFGEHCATNPWGEWILYRESPEYDIYMDCHAKPTVPDKYTFDHGYASRIHVYPDVYEEFVNDQYWGGKYTIMPDMGSGLDLIDFTVGGIKYKMTAEDKVSVVYPNESQPSSSNPSTYSGDVTIPAQVTFEDKTYNVTGIGNYAFRNSGLTSITLPEGLVSIGKEAIYNTKITEITLPNSVTKLGESCISENANLKTITVGKNIAQEKWGSWVFWRSQGGYDVYMICDAMPKLADNQTFDDSHQSTIHVYPSLYLDYTSNYYWANHNIVADLQEEISNEQLQGYIATYSAKLPGDEEVGTDPGFYTAASVKELKDALAFATSLDENASLEQRNKAYLGLIVANNGLSVNPLNEGYYYIEGLYNNKYWRSSSDNYVAVKEFAESDARFCFKLTHKGSNWYIQSADESKMYVGAPDGEGWVTATGTPDYEQIITWVKGGIFKMQCLNGETASNLYGQSSGYLLVKDYTEDNNRAQWRFHPVQSGTFAQEFNIENIRVREYMAEVSYTRQDASKMEKYNVAPPVRRDTPEPATIFWTRNEDATAQYITWSTNADFAEATPVEVNNKDTYYEIFNLIPGQTYYYKVTATVDGNETELINSSFSTSGQLRQIKADGGGNIRDLGGWATASGKPIKYGYIYRGAEWNGKYNLTPEGIAALRAIGMKAELDLRTSNEALYIDNSPLGGDVTYLRINNVEYYEGGLQNQKPIYKKNMEYIFDCVKKDRPVFFHCHIGADRTGTLAFLIEGLLGVSESDIYKDYEITTFSYFDTERLKENADGLIDFINTMEGETLTDKFYTYCHKELGLTAKDIADFRMKMLGTVYPADIENLVSETLRGKATSIDLSNYVFEANALAGSMPDGSNLLVTVSPESGITGTNIINNGVCENLVLTDGSDFGAPYAFTAANASYMTQVDSYRTLILPFEATVPAEFIASKVTSVTGTTVNLSTVTSVSANRPVLVQGEGQLVLTATDVAVPVTTSKLAEGLLRGVYKSTAAEEGSYVLQNQNDVTGFYCVADVKPTINAFRAYLEAPASDVKAYFFSEDATGIKDLNDLKDSNDVIYNIAGQRLSKMQKGVNIVNGKKILK